MVVCVWMPLLATVTLAQYGCGKKVTVNVVVAAVRTGVTAHGADATSMPLHRTSLTGVTDCVDVAKALPAAAPLVQRESVHFKSQYRAHSAPVSAAYIADRSE